jgi:K+-transporting ATPase ATPase A chain
MTFFFVLFCINNIYFETRGNPELDRLGISQHIGAMEGKEVRLGSAATAYWSVITTSTSNGSVNGMHDSLMPLSGGVVIIDMMINALYGGVGVGLLNYYIFIIIAVFISGLMVGRTPEFMGHKVEAREVKIAAIVTILCAFLIKVGTALASYILVHFPNMNWAEKPSAWLNNPSYHGFSEMLYQYTSSTANNGSGFEGLGDNSIWWNVTTGVVMLLARFIPIIGPVAIAGLLANKKYIPDSAGTLRTDTATFGIMTIAVIVIVTALSYFPPLALGPIAEYFSMHAH